MKKSLFLLFTLLIVVSRSLAQHAHFTNSGTIEYERTVNVKALLKKIQDGDVSTSGQALEQAQKGQPQFKTMKSTLVFNKDRALFTPVAEEVMAQSGVLSHPLAQQLNTIYTDLDAHTNITQKNVRGAFLLVKDSVQKIKWKLTNETRDIAGYPCRRANGLLLDSVYVVAFYTDKIPVSAGPEWFGGLSGMILEIAIPHENLTWIAIKVTDAEVPASTIGPPKKGKAMNTKQLYDFLRNSIINRDYPKQASLTMKGYLL